MTPTWKTYCVTFYVRDYYAIDTKARSEREAIVRAQHLNDRYGEDPAYGFAFDVTDGGSEDWHADKIQSPSINESNAS